MGDSFTIQLTPALVNQLSNDTEQLKKKSRKPKSKPRRDTQPPQVKAPVKLNTPTEWPAQPPPIFVPVPLSPLPPPSPTQSTLAELDAIRSFLQESERVVERLQNQEQAMLQEVTQRAKELHDKEFKVPNQKPVRCLTERDASFECYKVHAKDPLKCADAVKSFQDCARRVRQQMGSTS